MVETTLQETPSTKHQFSNKSQIINFQDIKIDEKKRIKTSDPELDAVMGGGLVPGMVVLLAGEPGIGKSTILTQVILKTGGLYVCGEESASQVALRIKRIGTVPTAPVLFLESTNVDDIIAKISDTKPSLVIVDSIQTLTTEDLTGAAGSVGQVRECAQRLTLNAKRLNIPIFIVGHVTKEGTIAGPRVLEHIVDTVLWFEGERSANLRLIRAVKNRFGPTDEVAVFEMAPTGLVGVDNPSKLLLAERVKEVPGSVVSVLLEGTKPMLIEIQSLVVPSQIAIPRRVATGIDMARLQMLVAILTKHANLSLGDSDVFVNVTGGIRLADRGTDLAICLAIASSLLNRAVPADIAAVGEVGLLGEVRKITGLDRRVKEAKKLGYRVASAESGKSVAAAIKKLMI